VYGFQGFPQNDVTTRLQIPASNVIRLQRLPITSSYVGVFDARSCGESGACMTQKVPRLLFAYLQDCEEGLLRNIYLTYALHALLALFLFLQ
jgi:hypothetical protein